MLKKIKNHVDEYHIVNYNVRRRWLAQSGSATGLGPVGRKFESYITDQNRFERRGALFFTAKDQRR